MVKKLSHATVPLNVRKSNHVKSAKPSKNVNLCGNSNTKLDKILIFCWLAQF